MSAFIHSVKRKVRDGDALAGTIELATGMGFQPHLHPGNVAVPVKASSPFLTNSVPEFTGSLKYHVFVVALRC
jgi:hypothetical protein